MLRSRFSFFVLLVCAAFGAARVLAIDDARLELAAAKGDGWEAQGLSMRAFLAADSMRAEIDIRRMQVNGLPDAMRDVHVACARLQLEAAHFFCIGAKVSGILPPIGRQQFTADVKYERVGGALQLRLNGLKLAGGAARIDAALRDARWTATVELRQAQTAELIKLARTFTKIEGIDGTGILDAELQARGAGAAPDFLQWKVTAAALTLNNAAGTLASDKLALQSEGSLQRQKSAWEFQARVTAESGQAYAEPVFLDMGKYALRANANGSWRDDGSIELRQFEIDQHDVIAAKGSGMLAASAAPYVRDLQLDIAQLQFPGAYAAYLQPFLLDTNFKAMNTSGSIRGRIAVQNDRPHDVDLELLQLSAGDEAQQLALGGLNGSLRWRNASREGEAQPRSRLRWDSGRLFGLELGAAELQLEAWGTTLRVAEPTRIPIFDGALAVEAFRIRKLGTPQMAFMLDAAIEPINVARLCRAFGWPEFGGELAGKITKLRLAEGVLTLGATLGAQIFNGSAAVSNMRMEGVFSKWPRFYADIKLDNLDLEQVTQAFSFGRITGRLSGEIDRLSLFNWEPVAFDAKLYTPVDDRSRHRISQRAVQNIGSIGGSGGGVATALQSGVLRFFDDFNYDRLGLSCKLENEVCAMNGVAPAPNGYYLVKGKGLPRIDVIGNAKRVDWPRMVAQLKAVTESSGPVVQ